jgi:hypothetical protein
MWTKVDVDEFMVTKEGEGYRWTYECWRSLQKVGGMQRGTDGTV